MNGFGNWLRNVGYKLRTGMQHFMQGRYGTDKLNMAILCTGLGFSVLAALFPGALMKMIFTAIAYTFMFIAIFRTLSRNIYSVMKRIENFSSFSRK
jgi:hypothetical protein